MSQDVSTMMNTIRMGMTLDDAWFDQQQGKFKSVFEKISIKATLLRLRIIKYFGDTNVMKSWEISQFILALFSCIVYVNETYGLSESYLMWITQLAVAGSVLIDFGLSTILSKNKFRMVFQFKTIVDILSLIWSFGAVFRIQWATRLGFVRMMRCFRLWTAFSTEPISSLRFASFNVTTKWALVMQMSRVIFSLFCFAFCSAGIVLALGNEIIYAMNPEETLEFHDTFYFVMVTLTTTGYGDVLPNTTLARFVVIGLILGGVIVIPWQGARLVKVAREMHRHSGGLALPRNRPHVVFAGHITFYNVLPILKEFFHDDRGAPSTHVVLLSHLKPSKEMNALLLNPFFQEWVTYLRGSLMNDYDLGKAKLRNCKACFILIDKTARESDHEDASAVVRALSLKQYTGSTNSAIVQILRPRRKGHLKTAMVSNIICVNELRLSVLGAACIYPGISTFISNLCRSISVPRGMDRYCTPWMADYTHGMKHEILGISIPTALAGKTFKEAAEAIYFRFGAVLFAMEYLDEGRYCEVLINPIEQKINGGEYAYVIAMNIFEARKISEADDVALAYAPKISEMWGTDVELTMPKKNKFMVKMKEINEKIQAPVLAAAKITTNQLTQIVFDETIQFDTPSQPQFPVASQQQQIDEAIRMAQIQQEQELNFEQTMSDVKPIMSTQQLYSEKTTTTKGGVEIEHAANFCNHIVVCSIPKDVISFILPIRNSENSKEIPIVFLYKTPASASVQRSLANVENIFYMRGKPTDIDDLLRAGVDRAKMVVIPASSRAIEADGTRVVDSDAVLTYLELRGLGIKNIIAELVLERSTKMLKRQEDIGDDFFFWTGYVEGSVYETSTLDCLTVRSYFEPRIMDILGLLTQGNSKGETQLFQFKVPFANAGNTYSELFSQVLGEGLIIMGIYRDQQGEQAVVFTNPPSTTVICAGDLVFALKPCKARSQHAVS